MKKTLLILFTAISASVYSQAPQCFAYQGVARDVNGNPVVNQSISIRASILHGTTTGTVQYSEIQTVQTSSLGLFSISIGTGTVQSGSFPTITWGFGLKFMKVEFDPSGGTNYFLSGTQQIRSVPYALNALNAKKYIAGNGIYLSGDTIHNNSEDITVSITGTGATTVTGTYPNFNINTNISSCFPKYITNVNLVNNVFSATYLSLDCSSYVPAGANFVILNIRSTTTANTFINFRKDATSQSIFTNSGISSATGHTIVSNMPFTPTALIIPIDTARKFQYLCTGTGTATLLIDLIGYY